jgi:hypothetical protein
MIALLIALVCHGVLIALCQCIGAALAIPAWLVWLAYWTAGTYWLLASDLSWPWLRSARLSNALRRGVAAVRFDDRSYERLCALRERLEHGKQAVFAIEPHGYACISVALLFAGYGTERSLRNALGPLAASRVRVVSHWIALGIPFVRELYAVFGVVDSSRATVFGALERGAHIAVIPSGMAGKELGALHDAAPNVVDVVRRPDERLGFVYAAAHFRALLVPVLAIDENHAYASIGPSFAPWWAQVVLGRYFVAPFWRAQPMRVAVGEPLDAACAQPRPSKAHIHELAQRYYAALEALARENNVKLVLHCMDAPPPPQHAHAD